MLLKSFTTFAGLGVLALAAAGCVVETVPAPQQPVEPAPAVPVAGAPATPGAVTGYNFSGRNVPFINGANAFGSNRPSTLRGLVYFVPATNTRFPDVSGMVPDVALYTPELMVSKQRIAGGFPGVHPGRNEWFAIRYDAAFNVASAGPYTFQVVSDDSANVYIDGQIVVTDDGLHSSVARSGSMNLNPGRHAIRVDYLQGVGDVELRLYVVTPGAAARPFTGNL